MLKVKEVLQREARLGGNGAFHAYAGVALEHGAILGRALATRAARLWCPSGRGKVGVRAQALLGDAMLHVAIVEVDGE
jgi:hypothetical protein